MSLWDDLYEAEKRSRILGGRMIRSDDEIRAWETARREVDRLRNAILRSTPWLPDPVEGPEMPRH